MIQRTSPKKFPLSSFIYMHVLSIRENDEELAENCSTNLISKLNYNIITHVY